MQRKARWTILSALIGLMAGLATTLFLYLLDMATRYRITHPSIVWGLPFAGLIIGWTFFRYGREASRGHDLILEEVHVAKTKVPLRMAPLILLGTLLTHLFGGSAGREGTAVQMGASLADQLQKFFKIEKAERNILLVAGMGAGFGAAIGAPLAGMIFGAEVRHMGRFQALALWQTFVASIFSYGTAVLLGAPHSHFAMAGGYAWNVREVFAIVAVGIACGLLANGFIRLVHLLEDLFGRYLGKVWWRPFVGGCLLAVLFQIPDLVQYEGLGIESIQHAFVSPASFEQPFMKAGLTVLTLSSGFKGGEFIPLVFMGSTLASAIAGLLHISLTIATAIGFAAVFGAATNTPLACAAMGMELFGWQMTPYLLIGCFLAYFCSGQRSIYRAQRPGPKLWWLKFGRRF